MARQVRPWLAWPEVFKACKVRPTDRGLNQRIPSGTSGASRIESSNVRVQSLPLSRHELKPWKIRGVHLRKLPRGGVSMEIVNRFTHLVCLLRSCTRGPLLAGWPALQSGTIGSLNQTFF